MDSQNNVIEALTDDSDDPNIPDGARDVTSDYEDSQTESVFGSLTSSINEHVWEYGRYYCSRLMLSSSIHILISYSVGDITVFAMDDTQCPTTMLSSRGKLSGTPC